MFVIITEYSVSVTYKKTKKKHLYYVSYSSNSHQHVSAAITAILRVMLILQEYKVQMWLAVSVSLHNN